MTGPGWTSYEPLNWACCGNHLVPVIMVLSCLTGTSWSRNVGRVLSHTSSLDLLVAALAPAMLSSQGFLFLPFWPWS